MSVDGAERKSAVRSQTDAIDPERTCLAGRGMSPPEVKSGHRCDHRSSDPRLQDRRGHLAAS